VGANAFHQIFIKIDEIRWGQTSHLKNSSKIYHFFIKFIKDNQASLNHMQTAPTTSTSSGPLSKKVSQKGYFKWNKDLEHVLAKEVSRAHAYKNTKDSSMKVKWQNVLTRLKATYPVKDGDQSIDFTDLDITAIASQNHFKRIMEDLEKKAAISEEGANLSGLPEVPSELNSLLMHMSKEADKVKHLKKRDKENDVLKDLNSGTNDELDRQLKEQQFAAAKAQADALSALAAYYTFMMNNANK
jgi:hypothetical protein